MPPTADPHSPHGPIPPHDAAAPALTLGNIRLRYGGVDGLLALDGVTLRLARGEFVALVGPSGCGKTSLLHVAGGLLSPSDGAVRILGGAPETALRAKRVGFVFQEPALLPWRDVSANVALPLTVNRAAGGAVSVEELLRLVGLEAFHDAHPHQLSGGMQQRVALARALVFDPDLLLMDEPFAALDEITRELMRYELLRIWAAAESHGGERKTVLFVTHSVAEAVALADRVLVMSALPGRLRAVVEVDLPRPRRVEHERSSAFLDAVDRIRALLRDEPRA